MDKRNVAILFGGRSAEHEVSIITGLQVIENIDRKLFNTFAIRLSKQGLFEYFERLNKRQDYLKTKPQTVNFNRDEKGTFFQTSGVIKKKVYVDAAYLAFHGGNGEDGQIQGFLDILDISYTSPSVETSTIAMNKALTKVVLEQNNLQTVPFTSVFSEDIIEDVDKAVKGVLTKLKLPVIIKPTHLGSSIGINIANSEIELKKFLLEAAHVDSEILIEKLMKNFYEYNVSVRRVNGKIETSEVEKPIGKGEILSFADKYEKDGKKTGGMASLSRELPAKISAKQKETLQNLAKEVFRLIRGKGMVRIDFMLSENKIYVTEVNPIPGSMSFYLWEASGISFKEQITDLIYQAIKDHEAKQSLRLEYKSDIVEKFVASSSTDH